MKLNDVILENGEKVIIDHTRQICVSCNKEVFFAMNHKHEKIVTELVGLAKWDIHKCVFKKKKA